jgi:hypothetical protein
VCHMSHVTCQEREVKLVSGGSDINGATPSSFATHLMLCVE